MFNVVGGWDSIGIIIEAVSDPHPTIRDRGWDFMITWYQRAFKLFTKPDPEIIAEVIKRYESSDISSINRDTTRLKIWKEIGFYLKR